MTIKNQLKITTNKIVDSNSIFETVCFNSYLENQLVGYLKIKYVPKEKLSLISDCVGYLIFKSYFDDLNLVNDYKTNNIKNILIKIGSPYLKLSKEEISSKSKEQLDILYSQFVEHLSQNYNNQRIEFINYWVNKPSIDLVRVFSDKDTNITDYSSGNPQKKERSPINWQNKGIGTLMYEESIKWCSNNNLELWASKTRTEDAKHIWNKLEHMPNFLITFHSNFKYLINKEQRPSVKLKIRG